MIGIDQEAEWVKRCNKKKFAKPTQFLKADANQLPFKEEQFDLVTCQTVLIHLQDPQKVLKEFYRVLKPGGMVLLAEPNNLGSSMVTSFPALVENIEERLQLVELDMRCIYGKKKLGEGSNLIGDLIPGFLKENNFSNIKVYQNDRPHPIIPPYLNKEEKSFIEDFVEYKGEEFWTWNKKDSKRYFLAGHGTEDNFEKYWTLAMQHIVKQKQEMKNLKYHTAGGLIFYLIAATKK